MWCLLASAVLAGGLWLLQKHVPRGIIEMDYFKGDLQILDDENIPTF